MNATERAQLLIYRFVVNNKSTFPPVNVKSLETVLTEAIRAAEDQGWDNGWDAACFEYGIDETESNEDEGEDDGATEVNRD